MRTKLVFKHGDQKKQHSVLFSIPIIIDWTRKKELLIGM
jgi:hypothetical protein